MSQFLRPDGGVDPSPSPSTIGSSGGPSATPDAAPLPSRGCHPTCKCYEPPYHPDEIDCHLACTNLAAWASDSFCGTYAGTEGVADCERRCGGIRATCEKPNIGTYIASAVFGCATPAASCEATKSCVQAITDQQKTVCP